MSDWASNTIIISHNDFDVICDVFDYLSSYKADNDIDKQCYSLGSRHWTGTIKKNPDSIEISYETKHGGDQDMGEKLVKKLKEIDDNIYVDMSFDLVGVIFFQIKGFVKDPEYRMESYDQS
jgi:hypothetical protein